MNIEQFLQSEIINCLKENLSEITEQQIQIQKTRKEFDGDYTLVVFPLVKMLRTSPEKAAEQLGEIICGKLDYVEKFNVVKGFLNLKLRTEFWVSCFNALQSDANFGFAPANGNNVMIEYSSPNTNKPLHLGHIRNNLLGYSVSKITAANGNNVIKVNLVNDRGIHICKSMIAWQKFGNGETPESTGMKGDHLVGKYYVAFDKAYKAEIKVLVDGGMEEDLAKKEAPIMKEASEMLVKWEAKDLEVYSLWETMNAWVYKGFDATYKAMGVDFDKVYYESNTYLLGKKLVEIGLSKNVLYKREDGSVWIDLVEDGLDEKLLLRADGTSVYMTQDLGTALERYEEYQMSSMMYVVGNEQNYHFQVLKLIMKKMGYDFSDGIYHLSYGMVELPEGKMKSREGTVVDADELIAEMISTAKEMSLELGKLSGFPQEEVDNIARIVGLGALKYFILKVDPRKNMLFDPKESIDFNGNTGPFIQYTYARIRSVLRKAAEQKLDYSNQSLDLSIDLNDSEVDLITLLNEFESAVTSAGENNSPAVIANYCFSLAKEFNSYYHDYTFLKEACAIQRNKRLAIAEKVSIVIKSGLGLMGIEVPERM